MYAAERNPQKATLKQVFYLSLGLALLVTLLTVYFVVKRPASTTQTDNSQGSAASYTFLGTISKVDDQGDQKVLHLLTAQNQSYKLTISNKAKLIFIEPPVAFGSTASSRLAFKDIKADQQVSLKAKINLSETKELTEDQLVSLEIYAYK